jgi:hypothetical protein
MSLQATFQSIDEDTEMTTAGIFVGLMEGDGLFVLPATGLAVVEELGLKEGI